MIPGSYRMGAIPFWAREHGDVQRQKLFAPFTPFRCALSFSARLAAALFLVLSAAHPAHAGKPTGPTSPPSKPMSLEYANYNFRNLSGDNSCLGEDDALEWKASGSLKPGESFSFTPQVPACQYALTAISAVLSWQGSKLELSSVVPDKDFASWDPGQKGAWVVAPSAGNTAQLCMFPAYKTAGLDYTITVTNVGGTTADNIALEGHSDNDWAVFYHARCVNADADHDGWNDSLEHSMANLLYPITGNYQPYRLWGSNYLRAEAQTALADDEVDAYPADLNDDGVVDSLDVDKLAGHLGEGNGIALESISPNPGDPGYYWDNTLPWRRFDLDGDGYVSETDAGIVASLVGQPLPLPEDGIAPTARVTAPAAGATVPRGNYYRIRGHVWDNAAVSRVEYLVDGRTACLITDPVPTFGYESPFYSCWWAVPRRQGPHEIAIRVYDAAGNVTVSDAVSVMAQ